jgi:hypothetical protein
MMMVLVWAVLMVWMLLLHCCGLMQVLHWANVTPILIL